MNMYEKLDALESVMMSLREAAEYAKELGEEYAMTVDCILDVRRELQLDADELKAEIEKEEDLETAALEREYYRSVI